MTKPRSREKDQTSTGIKVTYEYTGVETHAHPLSLFSRDYREESSRELDYPSSEVEILNIRDRGFSSV